jgi:predicted metal-binding protein
VIRVLASRWQGSVLVCGKCSNKLRGGFGDKGRTSLAKLLRETLGLKKGRKAERGVVEVKCLGVCPKNAVVMVDGAQPDRWMLVPVGADAGEVVAMLADTELETGHALHMPSPSPPPASLRLWGLARPLPGGKGEGTLLALSCVPLSRLADQRDHIRYPLRPVRTQLLAQIEPRQFGTNVGRHDLTRRLILHR